MSLLPLSFNVNSSSGYVANVGGYWNNDLSNSGPFNCNVNNSPSNTNTNIGARLCAACLDPFNIRFLFLIVLFVISGIKSYILFDCEYIYILFPYIFII